MRAWRYRLVTAVVSGLVLTLSIGGHTYAAHQQVCVMAGEGSFVPHFQRTHPTWTQGGPCTIGQSPGILFMGPEEPTICVTPRASIAHIQSLQWTLLTTCTLPGGEGRPGLLLIHVSP